MYPCHIEKIECDQYAIKKMQRTNLGITNKSSVMVVLFISTMEVPFNAAEICEVSVA